LTINFQALQAAAVDGEQVLFILEDYQVVDDRFLELVNSILSSGEAPGLYQREELEPMLNSLREQASQDGFVGSMFAYFAKSTKFRT